MAGSLDPGVSTIVAGIKGSGKTTFVNDFFELLPTQQSPTEESPTEESPTEGSPAPQVITCVDKEGRKIMLTEINEEGTQELKELYERSPDQLIYCVSVFQFNRDNHALMESLQENFGKDIWKRCKLILTHSNCAREILFPKNETEAYKNHLNLYARLFEEELRKLGVHDIIVRTAFAEDESTQGKHKIKALPDSDDQVVAVPYNWKRIMSSFYSFLHWVPQ